MRQSTALILIIGASQMAVSRPIAADGLEERDSTPGLGYRDTQVPTWARFGTVSGTQS
jgi:hypothetical protein